MTIVQIATALVIARLLTPEQLGVYSVAAALVAIGGVLRDFGVSPFLISSERVDKRLAQAAFGLLLSAACVLCATTVLIAPWVADFYRDTRLENILYILAINFLISPFGAITLAMARRKMQFKALAFIGVLSAVASGATSVLLAWSGWGAESLAWGGIAGSVALILASLPLRPFHGVLVPTLKGVRPIIGFGSASAVSHIVANVANESNDLILGRLINLEAVAFFNRARSLPRYVNTAINTVTTPVLLPWLAQVRRTESDVAASYAKVVEYTTGVSWPAFAILIVFAEQITLVMFGDQWTASARLVPYIAMAAAIASAYAMCSSLYLSAARPGLDLIAQTVLLGVRLPSLFYAAQHGLDAVAIAWLGTTLIGAAMHQFLLFRALSISPRVTLVALRRSSLMGAVGLLVAMLVDQAVSDSVPAILAVLLGSALSGTAAGAVGLILKHPLATDAWRWLNVKINR